MLFQGTDGLHQGSFKAVADAHNLSGSFHLCGQGSFCSNELIKWKSWHLYYAVVKHWLKTCISFLCYCIFDLIQSIA